MAIQTVPYPLINGNLFDFSSFEFSIPGYPPPPPYGGVLSIQSIDYSDNLEPGEMRGAAPHVLARTRGKYAATAKLTLPKVEADNIADLIQTFGAAVPRAMGYLEFGALTITCSYYEPSMPALVVDQLVGFRVTKMSDAHKTGQEPLMVDLDVSLFMLIRNGRYPFDPGNLAASFGL